MAPDLEQLTAQALAQLEWRAQASTHADRLVVHSLLMLETTRAVALGKGVDYALEHLDALQLHLQLMRPQIERLRSQNKGAGPSES